MYCDQIQNYNLLITRDIVLCDVTMYIICVRCEGSDRLNVETSLFPRQEHGKHILSDKF